MTDRQALDRPRPATPELEFSRTVEVSDLKGRRTEMELSAGEDECRALARRFDVEGIADLRAQVVLSPFSSGNKVAMKARFAAEVAQTCVVTLAPLSNRVDGEFLVDFVPTAFIDDPEAVEFGVDEDDPPEPIVDGRIEIGELIAQHLGLAIDPFPRAPGVVFEGYGAGAGGEGPATAGRASPFAVLERLKSRKN